MIVYNKFFELANAKNLSIASRVILWNMWKMMNTDINVKLFYSI